MQHFLCARIAEVKCFKSIFINDQLTYVDLHKPSTYHCHEKAPQLPFLSFEETGGNAPTIRCPWILRLVIISTSVTWKRKISANTFLIHKI